MTVLAVRSIGWLSRAAAMSACLALAACASTPEPIQPSVGASPPPLIPPSNIYQSYTPPRATPPSQPFSPNAVGSSSPPSRPAPVIGREWAGPNTYLGPIPTLTVVLKPYDRARNIAACQAFLQIKTVPEVMAQSPLAQNIMPLRWLVLAAPADANDCDKIVDGSDYYAGAAMLGSISATTTNPSGEHVDVSGPGPFIIEQFADESGLHYVILDFSKSTNPQTDFANIVPSLSDAITYQVAQLGPKNPASPPATVTPPASNTSKPSASNPFGFLCDAIDSTIGKVVRAAMTFIPVTTIAVSYVDSFDKAACPAQPAATGASSSPSSATTTAKKKTTKA
jgi:hypothetical protein